MGREPEPGLKRDSRREYRTEYKKICRKDQFRDQAKGKKRFRPVMDIVLRLLYPQRCPLCDEILPFGQSGCCEECRKKLPWIREPRCMKCGKPVGDAAAEYCSDCGRTEHYYDRGTAPFVYTGALREAVYRMKFENRRDYLDFFAESMLEALDVFLQQWQPELVVAVPMHKSKERRRGYNQSELLAERISRAAGIPYARGALRCIRRTSQQKSLGRKERMRNLRGSFEAARPFSGISAVLVVDDVYTTGSTVDEVSRVLRSAGAEHIYFVVLCTGKGKKTVCTGENVCYT